MNAGGSMADGAGAQLSDCVVRAAHESDVALLLSLVIELAGYEKLAAQVVADETLLRRNLFGHRFLPAHAGDATR